MTGRSDGDGRNRSESERAKEWKAFQLEMKAILDRARREGKSNAFLEGAFGDDPDGFETELHWMIPRTTTREQGAAFYSTREAAEAAGRCSHPCNPRNIVKVPYSRGVPTRGQVVEHLAQYLLEGVMPGGAGLLLLGVVARLDDSGGEPPLPRLRRPCASANPTARIHRQTLMRLASRHRVSPDSLAGTLALAWHFNARWHPPLFRFRWNEAQTMTEWLPLEGGWRAFVAFTEQWKLPGIR